LCGTDEKRKEWGWSKIQVKYGTRIGNAAEEVVTSTSQPHNIKNSKQKDKCKSAIRKKVHQGNPFSPP